MKLPVALDVMGGDYGSAVLVEGALDAVERGHSVVLVGDRDGVRDYAEPRAGLSFVRASHAVGMNDAPSGVRRFPESSLWTSVASTASSNSRPSTMMNSVIAPI